MLSGESKNFRWGREEYNRRLKLVRKIVEGGYHHCFVVGWRLLNELMINTYKQLILCKKENGTVVIAEEKFKWMMKQNIIFGMSELIQAVAKHDPIAVLPDNKTKCYCNCLVN